MRVVEVGCGTNAGPYFEGVADYIVVDKTARLVERCVRDEPRMKPIVANMLDIDELNDSSIDVILARNVFGDPHLSASWEYMQDSLSMTAFSLPHLTAQEKSEQTKIGLLREASRLLVRGGRLVIVEQLTPHHARDFIEKINLQNSLQALALSQFSRIALAEVTPQNYAQQHRDAETWVSFRQ